MWAVISALTPEFIIPLSYSALNINHNLLSYFLFLSSPLSLSLSLLLFLSFLFFISLVTSSFLLPPHFLFHPFGFSKACVEQLCSDCHADFRTCTLCQSPFLLSLDGTCIASCPDGQTASEQRICLPATMSKNLFGTILGAVGVVLFLILIALYIQRQQHIKVKHRLLDEIDESKWILYIYCSWNHALMVSGWSPLSRILTPLSLKIVYTPLPLWCNFSLKIPRTFL